MADKLLKSIKFPTLPDRYVIGDSTLTEEGAAAEAKAVGEALATKADTKGTYEDLIVGGAEQLMADGYESDSDPYLFRPTGGSADVGNREYLDKIVGGTVAWNQLVQNGNFADGTTGWSLLGATATVNNGILTMSRTADSAISTIYQTVNVPKGHKIFYTADVKGNGAYSGWVFSFGANEPYDLPITTTWNRHERLFEKSADSIALNAIRKNSVANGEVVYAKNIQIIDLTAMFGSTIADYIYSLEQATAGAGVAWFRNYFPKDYYPYDPGTLRSVEGVSAHETVGFNQWDEEWESGAIDVTTGANATDPDCIRSKNYIPVVPSSTYYVFKNASLNLGNIRMCLYDADKNFIKSPDSLSNTTIVMTDNTHYVRFYTRKTSGSTTYNGGICINLSDPSRNGEYEPYTKHTYPLDSSLTLRGVPKLDASNNLYYDGDTYESDGTVTRKYGVLAMDTVPGDWAVSSPNVFELTLRPAKFQNDFACLTDSPYIQIPRNADATDLDMVFKAVGEGTKSHLYFCNRSVTTISDFLSTVSGKYLVYELATPTTETADGYEQYQMCDPSGTEEFVTTGIVPVGHETRYPHDLKKKIETAPDSPSADGTYLMKRSGGKNTYMALPSTPSANGAYVLTVTVSGGTASYSWTAKE